MISSSAEYTNACHKYYGVKRAAMEYGIDFDRDRDIVYDYSVQTNYRKLFCDIMSKLIIQMVSSVVLRFHH